MPQISVIIPVYKVEPYLCRCVDSILTQTFCDFELILVDDGSPDRCPSICDEYKDKDNRIVVIHQKNGGLSAARNTGIDWAFANSDSQWLTFIDSDDWVHPCYLEVLYNSAICTHTLIARAGMRKVVEQSGNDYEIGDLDITVIPSEEAYVNNEGIYTYAWGQLYHKSLFQSVRYPLGRLYEDIAVYHKILFQTDNISTVDFPGYFYFQNPEGIQRQQWDAKKLDELWSREQALKYLERHVSKGLQLKAWKSYVYTCVNYLNGIPNECKGRFFYKRKYSLFLRGRLKFGVLKCELLDKKYHEAHFNYVQRAFPIITNCYILLRRLKRE